MLEWKQINQSNIVWRSRTRNRNGILFGIKQHCDLKIQLNVNLVQVLRDQNLIYFKIFEFSYLVRGLSWPWSHVSWIYNFLHNQCLQNHDLKKKLYRGYFLTNFAEIFAHKCKMFWNFLYNLCIIFKIIAKEIKHFLCISWCSSR
jgi:hypothetical protein